MNDSAIDDLLDTELHSWYSGVSQWMPASPPLVPACTDCHEELRDVLDPDQWPHELVDSLASAVDVVSRHLANAFIEDDSINAPAAARLARGIVLEKVLANEADIRDVLEQCITYRVQAWRDLEFDIAALGGN